MAKKKKKMTKKATKKTAKKATKKAAPKKAAKKAKSAKATKKSAKPTTAKKISAKITAKKPKKTTKPHVPSLEDIARDKSPATSKKNPFAPATTPGAMGGFEVEDEGSEESSQHSFGGMDDEFEPTEEYNDPDLEESSSDSDEEEESEGDDEGYF